MQRTEIEWTRGDDGSPGYTSNPFRARNIATGKMGHQCEITSPGCEHCYSWAWNIFRGAGTPFTHGGAELTEPVLDEAELLRLLKSRKTGRVFCFDMTDAFWSRYPDEWLDKFFAVVACQQNLTFQVLTKRAKRLPEYFRPEAAMRWARVIRSWLELRPLTTADRLRLIGPMVDLEMGNLWPLPNLWLGVSCEDQRRADERIPYLLKTPAAVRFVSAEPLLGPINFDGIGNAMFDREKAIREVMNGPAAYNRDQADSIVAHPKLDWVIVGGESGRDARPMHPEWARDIRDQCQAAAVPFFFKQWGEWAPKAGNGFTIWPEINSRRPLLMPEHPGREGHDSHYVMQCVGKKHAGRLLDRREWNEFPRNGTAETARAGE